MEGENRITNILLRTIGNEKIKELDNFCVECMSKRFLNFESTIDINNLFSSSMKEFKKNLTLDDLMSLRSYTGYNFKYINSILRGNWNYEENGLLDGSIERKYRELAFNIESLINKFPSLNVNFYAYRGVELSGFRKYNIRTLEQLKSLNGKYIYDEGFTSTSIIEDSSYYGKTLENGKTYNVEMRYLISEECSDGALLMEEGLSFSPNQNEYLINKSSLSKVVDVKIYPSENKAKITLVLIPKKSWNIDYSEKKETQKEK